MMWLRVQVLQSKGPEYVSQPKHSMYTYTVIIYMPSHIICIMVVAQHGKR